MLHPDLYLAFATIAETSSFTLAAERLGLQQSTISQQIKRLETAMKRPLLTRDTHSVQLTGDGEALLDYARGILDLNRRIERHFTDVDIRGRLRVGISEDFAASRLPEVLRDFTAHHRGVDLELTVDISGPLYDRLDSGGLDVVLAKRLRGERRGALAWADDLVWAARPDIGIDPTAPVPLVVFGAASVTRTRAIAALERAGREWLVACTSGSLFGLQAAALAGLGIMPFARSLLPDGLVPLSPRAGLPSLGRVEFVVIAARRHDRAAMALVERIVASADRIRVGRG